MATTLETVTVRGKELPFIFEESNQLPIVSFHIVFNNRGHLADENLSGLSNISSSILNEGTKEDGTDFSEFLDEKAIQLSASSENESFSISLDSLKENFPRGIELLQKLLKSPNLTENTLERIKRKVLGSILQRKSNFDYIANLKLQEAIYGGTPYETPKTGTEETLSKISLSDVEKFLSETIVFENAIPIIGGDLNISEAKEVLRTVFEYIPNGKKSEDFESFQLSKERKDQTVFEDTKQAYIYFASPLNLEYNSSEKYKMRIASFILGSSGFGSRLMEEIRVKRGFAYSVSSSFTANKSRSFFHGHLQTKIENLEEAKKVLTDLIADFVKNGATADELEKAKKFVLGSEPLRNETLSQRVWRSYNSFYNGFDLDHHNSELQKIANLDLETLNKFIASHPEVLDFTFSIITKK
jgi:zinc protease